MDTSTFGKACLALTCLTLIALHEEVVAMSRWLRWAAGEHYDAAGIITCASVFLLLITRAPAASVRTHLRSVHDDSGEISGYYDLYVRLTNYGVRSWKPFALLVTTVGNRERDWRNPSKRTGDPVWMHKGESHLIWRDWVKPLSRKDLHAYVNVYPDRIRNDKAELEVRVMMDRGRTIVLRKPLNSLVKEIRRK